MKGLWIFLVNIFTYKENYNINLTALFVVLSCLLVALTISMIVAKKNNLYTRNTEHLNEFEA